MSKMRGVMSVKCGQKCKLLLLTGPVKSPSLKNEDKLEDPMPVALSVD